MSQEGYIAWCDARRRAREAAAAKGDPPPMILQLRGLIEDVRRDWSDYSADGELDQLDSRLLLALCLIDGLIATYPALTEKA